MVSTLMRLVLYCLLTTTGPWETMESSYEVEEIEEAHPEPPNIQEIILASTGQY